MINIKYIFNTPSLLSVCNCVYGCGVVTKHSMLMDILKLLIANNFVFANNFIRFNY